MFFVHSKIRKKSYMSERQWEAKTAYLFCTDKRWTYICHSLLVSGRFSYLIQERRPLVDFTSVSSLPLRIYHNLLISYAKLAQTICPKWKNYYRILGILRCSKP